RVAEIHIVDVDNDVTIVGNHAFAIDRVPAEFNELPGNVAAGHGNDFDRQRKRPELVHPFALVGNADEGLRHGGNNFLTGQGSASALDQLQMVVGLIGAVNVVSQVGNIVQVVYRYSVVAQAPG